MRHQESGLQSLGARESQAVDLLRRALEQAGWRVELVPAGAPEARGGDFIARRRKLAYLVEVKSLAEGRGDRLVPLWSQGWLQALRAAGGKYRPLVVVAAPKIPLRVAQQVLDFAAEHAPEGAAGVVDFEGLQRFQGEQLEALNVIPDEPRVAERSASTEAADLFSDLNQWMLKVLFAPLLAERYLAAPRAEYMSAKDLGVAAKVSPMSAFRFVRQLQSEGYLDERSRSLQLVRREHLLHRWQAAVAAKPVREIPMRFLHRSEPMAGVQRMMSGGRNDCCLALFAAADALGEGFVRGVPPHVYLPRLEGSRIGALKGVVPASRGESPDVLLRRPSAPKSVFRGAVQVGEMLVSDILQVWLDVASQPARGEEQTAQLRRHVLRPLFEE